MARKKPADEPEDGYQVGYGRPPREHQFQPGHSGNPKGRPKGTKNTETIMREILDEIVEVIENGKRKRISKRELMLHGIFRKAASGDVRALKAVLELETYALRNESWPDSLRDLLF